MEEVLIECHKRTRGHDMRRKKRDHSRTPQWGLTTTNDPPPRRRRERSRPTRGMYFVPSNSTSTSSTVSTLTCLVCVCARARASACGVR